jgi:tripartite motif-containing protein 71
MGGMRSMRRVTTILLGLLVLFAAGCGNPFFPNVETLGQMAATGLRYVKSWSVGSGSISGIAVDSAGRVYVVDAANVYVFNADGTPFEQWPYSGGVDLAVDNLGHVFVLSSAPLVSRYNTNGTGRADYGSLGTGDGQFDNPKSIACDATGNFYVVDAGNSRVEEFSGSGVFQSKWGTSGSGDGQFNFHPYGTSSTFYEGSIAFDSAGAVYVSDFGRVQKFTSSGTPLSNFMTNVYFGRMYGANYALGACVDSSGDVYCATGGYLYRYKPDGSAFGYLGSWNATGTSYIVDVTIDGSGEIFFIDTNLQQVQEFSP